MYLKKDNMRMCCVVLFLLTALVYISVILIGMTVDGTAPLFYELVCETTYPIAEGVTNSLLTLLNNVAAGIFFFVLMIPMSELISIPWHKLS